MRSARQRTMLSSCEEGNVTGTKSTAFGVSIGMLLAGSIVFGGQQEPELSGIHGIPTYWR